MVKLESHPNGEVSEFAHEIVERFFSSGTGFEDDDGRFDGDNPFSMDYQHNANDVNDENERSYEVYQEGEVEEIIDQ